MWVTHKLFQKQHLTKYHTILAINNYSKTSYYLHVWFTLKTWLVHIHISKHKLHSFFVRTLSIWPNDLQKKKESTISQIAMWEVDHSMIKAAITLKSLDCPFKTKQTSKHPINKFSKLSDKKQTKTNSISAKLKQQNKWLEHLKTGQLPTSRTD